MAGTGGGAANRGTSAPAVVNTWDKTITVTTGNSARGNSVTRTIPNPNYIDPLSKLTNATGDFKSLLASGTIKPTYQQKDVSRGRNGTERVDDISKPTGYSQRMPDGTARIFDTSGKYLKTVTPSSGGFSLGGLLSDIGGAVNNITSGISDGVSFVGKDVSENPVLKAAITAAAATAGVPPQVTAAILGANQAGQGGDLKSGLETALASYALGSNIPAAGAQTAGTTAYTGSGLTAGSGTTGLTSGGTIGLGQSTLGTTAATNAAASSLAPGMSSSNLAGLLSASAPAVSTASGATGLASLPGSVNTAAGAFGTGGGTVATDAALAAGSGASGTAAVDAALGGAGALAGVPVGEGLTTLGGASGASAIGGALGGSLTDVAKGVLGSLTGGSGATSLGSGLLGAAGGFLNAEALRKAASEYGDKSLEAAKVAAEAAKFKPVGVTGNFASTKYGYDANGNLTSAGYTLSPEMQAMQNKLIGQAGGLLDQAGQARAATDPMNTAAQRQFALGNQYLAASPQDIANKYIADQQALLAAGNASALTGIRDRLNATGRTGFSIGGGTPGQTASNPELQAYYNALNQQNLGLAANAIQGGMNYTNFGSNLITQGGNTMRDMYATQNAAYSPYNTVMSGANTIEGYGRDVLSSGMNIGNQVTNAGANAGSILARGMMGGAEAKYDAEKTIGSPLGSLLTGASANPAASNAVGTLTNGLVNAGVNGLTNYLTNLWT